MTHEEAIKAIQREIECVKRQSKTGECCRDELGCGACDLVFEDEWILEAYDMAIHALEAGIEKGHKDMLGYYPKTMTEDKLNEITSRVCDIFRHTEFYDCTFCDKGMGGDCIECEEEHTVYFLLDVIASLHNELYKQVKGKYYDYMFHWANHGYGGSPDDSMFKDQKEGDDNEKADS